MKKVLITGGTGFLGRNLIEYLNTNYSDFSITSLSRTEYRLSKSLSPSDNVTYMLGDIRDKNIVKYALKDCDYLIHTAALKHVDVCEKFPSEAISINVHGTINLLNHFCGEAFSFISSDKAEQPIGCYGATKMLGEKIVVEHGEKYKNLRCNAIRSGNIFGSDGSVIERWTKQIKDKNEISVTDLDMTRFFITGTDLAKFVTEKLLHGDSTRIYIPEMKSILLGDLANSFIEFFGNKDSKIQIVGRREGEKKHERLGDKTSDSCSRFTNIEIINALQKTI